MGVLTKEDEKKLIEAIEEGEVIEKTVAFSWDGTNLLVRFPKEIADFVGVNKENRFKKSIKFIIEEKHGKIKKVFDIVERKNANKTKKKKKIN